MAEVVKVPVLGNVKTPWLYAGAAAVAGIVGYAWWSRGTAGAAEDEGFSVELPADEFTPPTVVDSGISVGGGTTTPQIARNNVEWLAMAREQAAALGFTPELTAIALTKYLAKASLNPPEASLIRAVVQILGQPPNNGPYPITEAIAEPTPAAKPGAIGFVRADRMDAAHVRISWPPLADVTHYIVEGHPFGSGSVGHPGAETRPEHIANLGNDGVTYEYTVRGVNAAGEGPSKAVVFTA